MAQPIVEFFERRYGVKLLPHQRRLLEGMDSGRRPALYRPRFMGATAVRKIMAGQTGDVHEDKGTDADAQQ